jgi:ATP-dependent DNA helicase RecG
LLCRISDGTGWINIRLFYFSRAQQNNLTRGSWITCFGEVRFGRASFEMVHPEYRVSKEEPSVDPDERLTPVYPATEGVSQLILRRITGRAIEGYSFDLPELIPDEYLKGSELPTLRDAIVDLHRPEAGSSLHHLESGDTPAQHRLSVEELLAHHLGFQMLRQRRRAMSAPALDAGDSVSRGLLPGLGFELTRAQHRVVDEVLGDLSQPVPMLRLLQGDVGSGKTVVAAAAVVCAAASGFQSALLAPTELLAEQHARTISAWLAPLGINTIYLSGRMSAANRRIALAGMADGSVQVAIGTHALFQQEVDFERLALVVVDEQHRFGVDQRMAMRNKGQSDDMMPHQLIMTATPIPRTLAMTFYTELDVSSIDELPPGRTPVDTVVVPEDRREEVIQRIRLACGNGRQAYWVCPLIDESEALRVQDISGTAKLLHESLPDASIGLVHGRMKPAEKDKIMTAFRDGRLDVLVATTVIEVGVDVPNASLMIIENAERLGLSQLHQLRGRVGRGHQKSACVLLYKPPLGEHARFRLAALRDTTDGFEISRKDLELRGPGEVLGTRQTGMQKMRVADLVRDRGLLPEVLALGKKMMSQYPDRVQPLIRRWVRSAEQYGHV